MLKAQKKIRQGPYQLNYFDKLIASGSYDQGKKAGIWHFYRNGTEEQVYDYTNNTVLVNSPLKSMVKYKIANAVPGDSVVAPVKIGGYMAGFKLMQAYTNYFDSLRGAEGKYECDNLISLDEQGKIISWVRNVSNDGRTETFNVSFKDVPEDASLFLPAVVNGKPTASIINFHEVGYTRITRVISTSPSPNLHL